jgi:hypothetical protein
VSSKINLYGLGDKGVDLVSTPLHADPNSWRQLQNAEFSNVEGLGGVKKRGGLLKLNTDALNSGASIQALFNMPLETEAFDVVPGPASIVYDLLASFEEGGAAWRGSSDGTTFAAVGAMTQSLNAQASDVATVRLNGVLYFASDIGGTPKIYSWDGATLATEVASFPIGPAAATATAIFPNSMTSFDGVVYLLAQYTDIVTRLISFTPSGAAAIVTSDTTTITGAYKLAGALGRLWLLTISDAKVYRMIPGTDVAWTLDHTFTGTSTIGQAITGGTNALVVSTRNDFDDESTLWQSSAFGVWTAAKTITEVDVGPSIRFFVILFDDASTFIALYSNKDDVAEMWISEDAGLTWTLDADISALFSALTIAAAQMTLSQGVFFNGFWFLPFSNLDTDGPLAFIAKRTAPATWVAIEDTKAIGGIVAGVGEA